jgi:carbamoyltransferase
MLLVADVKPARRKAVNEDDVQGLARLQQCRSEIPAVTHVDYSARVQTVNPESNPDFYALIKAFEGKTGCPVLINTSFNVRGEPIVCSPEDAYRCFMRTDMDVLVLENILLLKSEQPLVFADEQVPNFPLD